MEDGGGEGGVGAWARRRKRLHPGRAGYPDAVEGEVLRRVAAGETLHRVSEDAAMPAYTTLCGWARRRPEFRAGLEAARRTAGARFRGPAPGYCEATALEIFDRLCQGEALIRICGDAHMPTTATVYRWMAHDAELREAVALAREIHGERMGELAFDAAMAVTPADWKAADVKLRHLRWWAGKLAPRRLGAHRATEPAGGEAGAAHEPTQVVFRVRQFEKAVGADGRAVLREIFPEGEGPADAGPAA